MNLIRIKHFLKNWKLGVHLLFRTKHFGVNNKRWAEWDSIFGWSNKKKFWAIITIKPIIHNWKAMKFRSGGGAHFLSDETYELIYNEKKDGTKMDKSLELAKKTLEFYKKLKREWDSKGKYVCEDPHEKIIPIDGLVIRCGKRKMVQLKSDIKVSALGQEVIDEINDNIEDILDGKSKKYIYEGEEEDGSIWVEIIDTPAEKL